jgi:hypothetical protein
VVVVVVDFVVVDDGAVGAVAPELSAGGVVAPGAGVAEASAGGVVVAPEASVEVDEVVVVLDASGVSAFFWQAPRAKLEAASTAAVAIRLERQVMDVMKWLPREKTQVRHFNSYGAGEFPKK